ncbi:DUF3467 domain-containing protein [bacterium SCSIO 12741]|nr:DUF3467 domain-containing protein [bacterium SCSIO 12741]
MSDQQEQKPGQLNIEISEEVAEGVYSNLAIITHSNSEFIVDFINVMPGTPKSKVKSRIVLNPHHAKRLYKALQDNLAKYEEMHGEIKDHGSPELPSIPLNFGGPAGEA